MSGLKRRYKVKSFLDNRSKGVDLLLSQELSVLFIGATNCAQVVSKGFDQNFGGLLVVTGKSLLQLLDVHWHGLLEELDVLGLTDSDEHALEGL